MTEARTPSPLFAIAGTALTVCCVLLGYWMRGTDVSQDARLSSLRVIERQLAEISSQTQMLTNADKTYWRGYSEGLTSCYTTHP